MFVPSYSELENNDTLYCQCILEHLTDFNLFFENKQRFFDHQHYMVRFEFTIDPTDEEIAQSRIEQNTLIKRYPLMKNWIIIYLWKKIMIWSFPQTLFRFGLKQFWFMDMDYMDMEIHKAWNLIERSYLHPYPHLSKQIIREGDANEIAWRQRCQEKAEELDEKAQKDDAMQRCIDSAKAEYQKEYLRLHFPDKYRQSYGNDLSR